MARRTDDTNLARSNRRGEACLALQGRHKCRPYSLFGRWQNVPDQLKRKTGCVWIGGIIGQIHPRNAQIIESLPQLVQERGAGLITADTAHVDGNLGKPRRLYLSFSNWRAVD